MDYLRSFVGFAFVTLSSIAALLYFQQRKLIYPSYLPEGAREVVPKPQTFEFEEIHLSTPDGEKLHAYFVKAPGGSKRALLFCHANAGNMGHRMPIVEELVRRFKLNVFIFSYRGYGFSTGEAHERGMKVDAQVALDYLLEKKFEVIVFGQSIGGAVASWLVSENKAKVKALILENTFLSMRKVVEKLMPKLKYFLFLLTEKWETEDLIGKINVPVLFIASKNDEIVPHDHMLSLSKKVGDSVLVILDKGTHNDAFTFKEYWNALEAWKPLSLK